MDATFTRRVVKGFKLFDEGPEKKKEGEKKTQREVCRGLFFGL